jgi:hypothetical protein
MREGAFLWLFFGLFVVVGFSATIAWYNHWPNWGASVLTLGLYFIYLLAYFWWTREQ